MDKTQEEIYLFLFRAWKHEVSSIKIGKVKDKDIILKDIKFLINKIKESIEKSDKKEKAIKRIHEKTLENILYMIKDFFDIRSEKILNLSRSLQIIDEETLFPVEKDYYKQLFLAFKGDSKTMKYLLASIENNHNIPDIKIDEKEKSQEINTPINSNSIPILKPDEISTNMESKIAGNNQMLKKNQDEEYILIRFTKNIPALVGKDLKVYGPFQKEDIAQLPIQNASILIEENAAIKINLES